MNDLATAAGIGIMTLNRFEGGQTVRAESIAKIVDAFATAGITFIAAGEASQDGGDGVRLTKPASS